MKTRRIPLRKCVACHQMMAKKELIRVVRSPEGVVNLDLRGRMAGRGAYLCGSLNCFQLAKKSKAFDRALNVPISNEIYDQLQAEFVRVESEFQELKEQADES
ncbi:MAG: hypothetical protein RLZZ267_1323 [Bacillota bacterium]